MRGPLETLAGAPIKTANFVVMGTPNSGFVLVRWTPGARARVDVSEMPEAEQ